MSFDREIDIMDKNKIVLTEAEKENIEVADFGLGDIEKTGLQIVTYINTERMCAKELIMLPGQTCDDSNRRFLTSHKEQ